MLGFVIWCFVFGVVATVHEENGAGLCAIAMAILAVAH
jgi:hypothetical protein